MGFDALESYQRGGIASITVWKRLGNECYILPGKYNGILVPSGTYMKITSTGSIAVISANKSQSLLIDIDYHTDLL